jgi:all-trans-retinol 13,14-reductase
MPDFDAIVIGSGAGGLTAALALARAGKRVGVFEQARLPGGYSQSFELEGYRFSPGVHYVGALQPGGTLRRVYEGLGVANDLTFREIDPDGYDRAFVGDERFDMPAGADRFMARLIERFPREEPGIRRYFALIGQMVDEMDHAAPTSNVAEAARMLVHLPTILTHGVQSLTHFLDGCTQDPLLRAILSIQCGDHGMRPARCPTALHAALQSYYFDGACYPQGGGHAIAEALIKGLEAQAGSITYKADVREILIDADGRAAGVRLADGRSATAPIVVSNADPGVTWGQLVPEAHVPARLRRRVGRTRWSMSVLSLFMAVRMDLRAAGIDSGNIWFNRTPDIDRTYRLADRTRLTGQERIEGVFFNVTTLKDPTMRTDDLHTVEVMAVSSMKAFRQWADIPPGQRGAEYAQLKADLSERILDAVECFVPGFREHVVFRSLATPLTNRHYVRATEGGIYGAEKSARNLGVFSFPVRTPIRGLYQCGASTVAAGINGVTRSGLDAAAAALGCQRDELLSATGQTLRIVPAVERGGPAGGGAG